MTISSATSPSGSRKASRASIMFFLDWAQTSSGAEQQSYLRLNNFSNSVSVKIGTPSSLALSYLEPGSAPTTT
jgi:hypothetical protein